MKSKQKPKQLLSSKTSIQTWHIWIQGQVQGVGFRPFVYQMASRLQIQGWVNNTTDGVHIEFNASAPLAQDFYQGLIKQAPILSRITAHQMQTIEKKFFDKFQIIHSAREGQANLLLTPDAAICPKCQQELHDPTNRRFRYPFISCTDCGVRFSVISALPYDREHTTMDNFKMCHQCVQEYNDPMDRRYFSQTNSCSDCSINLTYFDAKGKLHKKDLIKAVVEDWETGKIVAIKGIGGYLLTCAADQMETIQRLRTRKHRPSKAFALMFPDLDQIQAVAEVPEPAIQVLNYPVAAITLLEMKANATESLATQAIAPGLHKIGALLPYAPLFELLLKQYGKAIIATSGNISNAPIVFQDQQALASLFQVADTILSNDRVIVIPQDDSVVQFSPRAKQPIILRRSRGWAPTFIQNQTKWPQQTILAMGAMLKSTFTLLHQGNVYVSQYLGSLDHFDTEQHYQHTVRHYLKLLGAKPTLILSDQHPNYPSKIWAETLAEEWGVPRKGFQHHLAHFAAVLGENLLIDTSEAVLGVIWDGTGLGSDGQIWGGEFFIYQNHTFKRVAHWPYQQSMLGDKMAKEPRIAALSFFGDLPTAIPFLKEKFSKTEWPIYQKIKSRPQHLKTSSIGRLFDAVASILCIMDQQTYEGEAAMRLEVMATDYLRANDFKIRAHYSVDWSSGHRHALLSLLIEDLKKGITTAEIAAKFHWALVDYIDYQAQYLKLQRIAFSGGVFQNSLLVDLCITQLGHKYQLYWHRQLSPNDENISYGQLICAMIQNKSTLKVPDGRIFKLRPS